jgi:PAS domain S-box-containing protein
VALVIASHLLVVKRYFAAAESYNELTSRSSALVHELERGYETARRSAGYAIAGSGALALLTVLVVFRWAWATILVPLLRIQSNYSSLFDNAVAGFLLFDANGEVVAANPALARMLGYQTPAELARTTRNVHRQLFADPEHRPGVEALVPGGGAIELRTPLIRRDGGVTWALESASVVPANGPDHHFHSVFVDITETVKAEDGLRELSGLLLDSQERERRRIARELHDSTGQVLAALEMNLSRLQNLLGSASDALSETGDLATRCSREIRSMSYLLHPPLLDELGLVYAVRDYADGFAKRSGIAVDLDLPRDLARLSPDRESALFRVIQEALTNIHRHAESPLARIRLEHSKDAIVVSVEDEGRGIPPEVLDSERQPLSWMGVGMRGMAERLRQLGGRLTVTSSGRGTLVRGELPCDAPDARGGADDDDGFDHRAESRACSFSSPSARSRARSPGGLGL